VKHTLQKSDSNNPNNNSVAIIAFLMVLWTFGPSIVSLSNDRVIVASLTWIMHYIFEDSSFSFGSITNISPAIILHSLRLFFILYLIASLVSSIRFKVTVVFGFLVEIPFFFFTVYYALIPPGGYSYYLTLPIPIVVLTGIFLLMRKRYIRNIQAPESEAHRTGIDINGNLNHTR